MKKLRLRVIEGAVAVGVGLVMAVGPGIAAAVLPAPAAAAATGSDWVGSWSTADVAPAATGLSASGFNHQTVREIVHTTAGGSALRLRLSNVFGTAPLAITGVHVGVRQTGASIQPGTDRQVTFGGSGAVTIPAGERTVSDPVALPVPAAGDLAVSIYFDGASGPATWHQDAVSTNYYSTAGDHSGDTASTAYSHVDTSWFFLDGVDVLNSTVGGAVVTFGPSTTDGVASTPDANRRYPDDLGRRLLQLPEGRRMSMLNTGISGNQLLADGGTSGVSALKRFYRDVIDQTGVRVVILWEGTNDIGNDKSITASQIIDAWTQLISMAHQHGIRVIGATLQPDEGAGYYTEAGNEVRETANQWMRGSGAFDGVVDFDRVLRDPADPNRMLPAFDSGDHLHPNDAGYEAIADAINLQLLTGPASGAGFSGSGSVSPSALTVPPGSSAQATATVSSWSTVSTDIPWRVTAPPGVTITPDHGVLALPPGGSAQIHATVTGGAADGRFPVRFDLYHAGESVLTAPLTVYVASPGDLAPFFNNTGISDDGVPGQVNYDGGGWSYSEQALTAAGLPPGATITSAGLTYTWPDVPAAQPDNVMTAGQTIPVSAKPGASTLGFIGSAANAANGSQGTVTVTYTDGTTSQATLGLSGYALGFKPPPPQFGNTIVATLPYRNYIDGTNQTAKMYVLTATIPVDSSKTVASVTLPSSVSAGQMHIFGISGA